MSNPTMRKYPQRKSPRLQGYDYSQAGAYFVTICTHQRLPIFGEICAGEMYLSPIGEIAVACWLELPDHFPQMELDVWVVMPNHMHGIIVIIDGQIDGDGCVVAPGGTMTGEGAIEPGGRAVARPYETHSGEAHPYEARPYEVHLYEIAPDKTTLGTIINSYKGAVTRLVRQSADQQQIWQGRYHDHIIRDAHGLQTIREYVLANPVRWHEDTFFTKITR